MTNAEDLTGRRFGRWVVLGPAPSDGAARWRCRCDCGTERAVAAKNLKNGASTSCGFRAREAARARGRDLVGQKFGMLTVIGRAENDAAGRWRCRCDCGGECLARADHLASGRTHSCGCETRRRAPRGGSDGTPLRHAHRAGSNAGAGSQRQRRVAVPL